MESLLSNKNKTNKQEKISSGEKYHGTKKTNFITAAILSSIISGCATPQYHRPLEQISPVETKKIFQENNIGSLEEIEKFGKVTVVIKGDKYLVNLKQIHHGVSGNTYGEEALITIKVQQQIAKILENINTDICLGEGYFPEFDYSPEDIKKEYKEISKKIKEYQGNTQEDDYNFVMQIIEQIGEAQEIAIDNPGYQVIYQKMLALATLFTKEEVTILVEKMWNIKNLLTSPSGTMFEDFLDIILRKNYLNQQGCTTQEYTSVYYHKWLQGKIKLLHNDSISDNIKNMRALSDGRKNEVISLFNKREENVLHNTRDYFQQYPENKFLPVVFGAAHDWFDNISNYNQDKHDFKIGLIEVEPNNVSDFYSYLKKKIKIKKD